MSEGAKKPKTPWWVGPSVVLMISSILMGVFMAFYMDNPEWLLMCVPIFFFLS